MEELAEVRFFMSVDKNFFDDPTDWLNDSLGLQEGDQELSGDEEDTGYVLYLPDDTQPDPNNEPFEVQEEVNTTEVQDFDDTNAPASKNDQQDGREAVRVKLQIHGRYHKNATVRKIGRPVGRTICSQCGQDGHNKTSCARKRKRD